MSKYIVEIKPEYEDKFKGVMILGAENSNLYVDSNTVDELEELTADYINEHYGSLQDEAYKRGINDGSLDVKQRVEGAYQRGFDDGKKFSVGEAVKRAEYDKGLEDAWECVKKLYLNGMSKELFGRYFNAFIQEYSARQAIEMLKAYKQKKDDKIEVGDEVIYNSTTKCIVVRPEDDERYASLIDSDGTHYSADHRECKKTGRHFDIASILEEMRHD